MAEEVVIGIDRSGKEATVLVNENGYVELFRATDNPERLVISDFTKQGDIQSAGLGTQNYFATNAPYANKYTGTNKKLYKFSTNIKPNEILDISPVSLKNKHPELYTLIFGENEIRNTKAIQDNIETIKELGYKAIGNRETGSTGLLEVAQYEIIPLTTANETYNIKPIATLQTKEGFDAGKSPEAFIETSLDTPTNVVDDLAKQNELINNFVNSMKTEGNLEFFVKHSGTEVPASSIQYNPRIGKGSQIPGFYTEPLGIRDIKVMGGSGGPNAINNYYKVQVNSNNLLISAGGGKVTGLKSPISTVGNANLGNQIEKINWKIFEQETGLSWENDFNGKGLFSVERGEKVFSSNSQGFINYLKGMGLTDDEISSALRKSGIEGFVAGPTNAQYEVVLLDPNDELGIGKNINVQDATETDFVNNQSKVNQIDELVIDTPTNVVDDILKTQLDDIRILNDSGVSDQVDNIMAKKINDLYQTDGDIESFSKYLDNLIPDTFTETNKIKSILGFGKTGTGMRVTSRSINDGIGSRSPIIFDESRIDDLGYVTWKNLQHEYVSFQPSPNNVDGFELVKNLVNEGNEINFESMTDVVIPDTLTNVVDDVVMNKSEAIDNIDNLIDELPLEEAFKKQVKKNTARIGKNVATPGGIIDFIDAWELGVLALGVTAIATGEIDEIPTIMYNQGVKMYNNMLSSVGLPVQVEEKPYNINFEKAINTFNIAEMFMPTAYVEKAAVKEFKKGQEAGIDISVGLGAGVGVPPMQFKTEEPKEDTGNINSIMTNLMSNISNAQKSYPITADEIGTFGRNPINVVPEDTKDKPVKVEYDSKEKQNLHDIYAKLYKNLSNAGARVQ